jgi:RsiW-degrading membrane proteinase PrsW (M82 family)
MDQLPEKQTHFASLFASILFALSGLFLLGIGLLMGLAALMVLFTGQPVQAPQTIYFVALSFEAVLLFAAAFFALQKNLHKPSADRPSFLSLSHMQIVVGLLVAAGVILIGRLIGAIEPVNWLLLPILTIPAVVLPLGMLTALGTQKLPLGRRWQTWSVLGLSMTLIPLFLLVLEAVLGLIMFIVAAAFLMLQPERAELEAVLRQIMILGPQSEAALDLLSPFLTRPDVIIMALIYIAVLVPAIEELFKPLGVWLLARKLDSAAQGFTLGALSGAGYALIETIGVTGQQGDWASLLFTRIGTGLLHITTSALMGAAIVLAWRERGYVRLLGTYRPGRPATWTLECVCHVVCVFYSGRDPQPDGTPGHPPGTADRRDEHPGCDAACRSHPLESTYAKAACPSSDGIQPASRVHGSSLIISSSSFVRH